MTGRPKEKVRQFISDIQEWVEAHNISGYSRELIRYDGRTISSYKFEFAIHGTEGWKWLLENFEIRRPDLRARLFGRTEAIKDRRLYECLFALETPDNVLLGMLYEQPRTKDEITTSLQMREEGITASLKSMQLRGMVERRGDHYYYESSAFIERFIRDNSEFAEILADRMHRYSARLLNQCQQCHRVYIKWRSVCGMCGGEVIPVQREGVMKELNRKRRYRMMLNYRVTTKDTEGLDG